MLEDDCASVLLLRNEAVYRSVRKVSVVSISVPFARGREDDGAAYCVPMSSTTKGVRDHGLAFFVELIGVPVALLERTQFWVVVIFEGHAQYPDY